jgi:hypothetical protein
MNVAYFLRERTTFVREYYTLAVSPFEEIKLKIERGDQPYEPPYSEGGEPPFQSEWSDADTSVQVVGRTCVNMLSESLKLYFQTWEKLLVLKCQADFGPLFKSRGFLAGYKECLQGAAGLNWDQCPADLSIIEQVVLARNLTAHHNGHINTLSVKYPPEMRKMLKNPLFLHDWEKGALDDDQKSVLAFLGSSLVITKETLEEAVWHVELLVDWLEPKLQEAR